MKFLSFTVATVFSAGSAFAGGFVPPVVEVEPVIVAIEPANDWTGFYAGLQYGQGSLDLDVDDAVSFDAGDFDAYGVHAGYLHDFGQYVLGAELDYNRVEVDDVDGNGDLLRLRGRLGADLGRFLPYLTAGVARLSADDDGVDISETGFTYGLGADFAVTENFTIGAEYTRHNFSDVLDTDGVDLDADLIQIRAAYRF